MTPLLLYLGCLAGAIALYLLMSRRRGAGPSGGLLAGRARIAIGILLGVGAFVWLGVSLMNSVSPTGDGRGDMGSTHFFFWFFGILSVVSAVQMITTSKPVYAALHFVLVVLASSGTFLMLGAEFMAFALVIVYAGAILITYMFVLMLAQQSPDPDDPDGAAIYDIFPREPAAGALVGLILLALLTRVTLQGTPTITPRLTEAAAERAAWNRLAAMPGAAESIVRKRAADNDVDPETIALYRDEETGLPLWTPASDPSTAIFYYQLTEQGGAAERVPVFVTAEDRPGNLATVGYGLIVDFPVSLEVAGIILLMAMFGAVILARRQIEFGEDELRTASGMRPLGEYEEHAGFDDDASAPAPGGAS